MNARRHLSLSVSRALMIGALLCFSAGATSAETPPDPSAHACKADEVPVPDERQEGAFLCMTNAEWERAREICEALAPGTDPIECTCQDGDQVGACGD